MVILPSIRRRYVPNRIPRGAVVPMSECVVTLASDNAAYTGQPRTVGVTVTWEDTTLEVNVDYTLSYANNTNIGPATVTVTGMGQFSGIVTKTFHIVSGSNVPWTFDITKTTLVDSHTYGTPGGRMLLANFNDNYDGNGNGFFAAAMWSNGSWLRGFKFPRDEDGEFHLAGLVMTPATTTDSAGITDYLHAVGVSADGKTTFWADNGLSTSMLKQKSGTTAFDFTSMAYSGESPDLRSDLAGTGGFTMLANCTLMISRDGRFLFVQQPQWTVLRYTLGTPFDIATLDAASKSVQRFLNVQNNDGVQGLCFNGDGSQVIVNVTNGTKFIHANLSTPYDLGTATKIGEVTLTVGAQTMCVLNSGKTLLVGNNAGLYEYSLVA